LTVLWEWQWEIDSECSTRASGHSVPHQNHFQRT
jgi:hypothetical protein